MKIPGTESELLNFTRELVDNCLVSREARRMQYGLWRRLYYMGSIDQAPSKHNRCYSHVDKLSSYLFSPSDVRFDIELDHGATQGWEAKLQASSRYLNRKFDRSACDISFGQANENALIDGACILKLVWGPKGLQPWVIRADFFGVLREDIASLDRQEAFTHSFFVTPDVFARMIPPDRPDRDEIIERVKNAASTPATDEVTGDSYIHNIVAGGITPITGSGLSNNPGLSYGAVSVIAPPAPLLAPEVAAKLIRVDDLWVWNDKLEDWTTIRYVDPGIIVEGANRHRNLCDIKGFHPFYKVSSNEVLNYFWGRSELATVMENQKLINRRVDDVDTIFRLQARPPRSFSGFSGITEEKARTLMAAGGSLVEGTNPNARVDNLAPEMPPNALEYLTMLDAYFDDVAGFTNILSGQGEPGIRAGVHAGTLLRTSSARLRDRSLLVERQCAAVGNGALTMLRAKDATVLTDDDGGQFMLSQLPADACVTVDSHSSSPAFSEDNKQLLFALAKSGAIDEEDLIEGVQPPRMDVLLSRLRQRKKAEAEFVKQNPQALEALQGGKRKR